MLGTRAIGLNESTVRTSATMSSGWICSSPASPVHSVIFVATNAGEMVVARMPCSASSRLSELVHEPDPLRVLIRERAADAEAGRVDEDVHPAELLDVSGDDTDALVRIPEVRRQRERGQLGRRLLERLGPPCHERELVAVLAQGARDGEPDPGRASRHERRLHGGESRGTREPTRKSAAAEGAAAAVSGGEEKGTDLSTVTVRRVRGFPSRLQFNGWKAPR